MSGIKLKNVDSVLIALVPAVQKLPGIEGANDDATYPIIAMVDPMTVPHLQPHLSTIYDPIGPIIRMIPAAVEFTHAVTPSEVLNSACQRGLNTPVNPMRFKYNVLF